MIPISNTQLDRFLKSMLISAWSNRSWTLHSSVVMYCSFQPIYDIPMDELRLDISIYSCSTRGQLHAAAFSHLPMINCSFFFSLFLFGQMCWHKLLNIKRATHRSESSHVAMELPRLSRKRHASARFKGLSTATPATLTEVVRPRKGKACPDGTPPCSGQEI